MEWKEYGLLGLIGLGAIVLGYLNSNSSAPVFFLSKMREAAYFAFLMAWETWWALVLGFSIAGAVEAWFSKEKISSSLEGSGLREMSLATFFGFISSSCSFSAIATAKNLFRKGASASASLGAFMFASTNLVIEIGFVMLVLLGWQFVFADFVGGLILIGMMAVFFHFLPDKIIEEARNVRQEKEKVEDPVCGMELEKEEVEYTVEHQGRIQYFCSKSCMESFKPGERYGIRKNILSVKGWKRLADKQWKEWGMLYEDILVGFILAGFIAAFIPESIWISLFTGEKMLGLPLYVLWTSVLGALVGVATFVCSVGNVPFAAVLWANGLPFGSVLSYIYADLIVPPIIDAYRKYYGKKFATLLSLGIFGSAVLTGLLTHFIFLEIGLIPAHSSAKIVEKSVKLNYKAFLNGSFSLVFIGLYLLHKRD